ncbi:G kinase-anchoring protein 1-B-like [Anopheles nili]|uniref:G kinase-anchoring protein 1-B-like n=1 Tax=Anopheles nili TaxID=185578 RepID=UPI00237A1F76|nr:G kinase-anchoring protein 1-B-like [Anopheles nili]
MVTIVPSRFAGLKIEDDGDGFRKPKQKSKSKSTSKTEAPVVKIAVPVPVAQKQPKKRKPKTKATKELIQKEEWLKWQQKDKELSEISYMNDLAQAVLLSKLDFEANKTKYLQMAKETRLPQARNKKPKTLSLQEFQVKVSKEMLEKQQQNKQHEEEVECNKNTFFEQLELEIKQIQNKEQLKTFFQNVAESTNAKNVKEAIKKDAHLKAGAANKEMDQLKEENSSLKEEISLLRDRYKRVVGMLKHGEMREKTELMIEIEKLTKAQEDMIAEITVLYGQLEQAKSMSNQVIKTKPTNRRSVRFGTLSVNQAENVVN